MPEISQTGIAYRLDRRVTVRLTPEPRKTVDDMAHGAWAFLLNFDVRPEELPMRAIHQILQTEQGSVAFVPPQRPLQISALIAKECVIRVADFQIIETRPVDIKDVCKIKIFASKMKVPKVSFR